MLTINNSTQLIVAPILTPDRQGAETLLVIVKGTWRINGDGTLTLADEQAPVRLEPVYLGQPGTSSLVHDTDVVLQKPGTDCILLGRAWSARGLTTSLDVTFSVGPVRKTVRVFGERRWLKCLWTSMSEPAPFASIPLVWERSFGGTDASWPEAACHETCWENPIGRGFIARRSKLAADGMLLPNIEDPSCLITSPGDRPRPTGFGPIPSHWSPRARYAGTYDEAWQQTRSPLPPEDLDPHFYASASPGLSTARHLEGKEAVVITNASRTGRMSFHLSGVKPLVTIGLGGVDSELVMLLDTVVVEPDEDRLVLVWRGSLNVHGRVREIRRLDVQSSPL